MNKNTGLYAFEFILPANTAAGDIYYQSNEGFLTGKEISRIWYYEPQESGQVSDLGITLLNYSRFVTSPVPASLTVTIQDDQGRQILRGVDAFALSFRNNESLNRQASSGWEFPEGTKINWSRFKLHIGSSIGNVAPVSVVFLVEYKL